MASPRNGGQGFPAERRGWSAVVDSLGVLFRAVAFVAASFYSIALLISSFQSTGNIVRHEVNVILKFGSILAESTGPTGPGGPSGPSGPAGPSGSSGTFANLDPAGVI